MLRKTLLTAAAAVLVAAPATASATPQPEIASAPATSAQNVAFNTGSAAADAVINGLITIIFGPNDPTKCKFPYCF
ncbi:hypothetical protein VMT65_07270 [Nocardia sp. CDC153]|uniref:hypothetical protein n=1 Tax=Nocardia sp. CDC153 TaxID=3112167 RepID=UPI002DB917C5|nr:hypothetical protein [Nocardia sp. CDC153]MEC3952825.1 hypothetical protein [Nocardia sp. CDC153]